MHRANSLSSKPMISEQIKQCCFGLTRIGILRPAIEKHFMHVGTVPKRLAQVNSYSKHMQNKKVSQQSVQLPKKDCSFALTRFHIMGLRSNQKTSLPGELAHHSRSIEYRDIVL